jgi:RNA polymerase sigma factor (sigma-70 family)
MRSKPATQQDSLIARERETSWSALMAATQAGDRIAYDRLLREILPFVRNIVRARQSVPDLIEEIVQDVLLALHRVRHTYDPARPFLPWLAAITRHRAIDALRRTYRRAAFEVPEDIAGPAYEQFADPAVAGFDVVHATADHLCKAIACLPKTQREAVELLRLGELSLAEASQLTGRSIGALKVSTHRALGALRQQLSAH